MRVDWKSYSLDQLGQVGRGRSRHRPRNDPRLYGGAYPFFQTGDITKAEFYLHDYSATYNEFGLAQSKLWQPGTLCITIAANIAETALLAIPGCFPDSVVGFVPNPTKSDARFIKYYIDLIKLQMQDVSRGTTQSNLSLDKLLRFEFRVPEVCEQRDIADILSAYDDLIENNTRRIAILEEMARRIFEEWFVYFRAPGCEGLPTVESGIGPIPQGWEVVTIKDICERIDYGFTAKASNDDVGPKFLRITDIVPSTIDWTRVPQCVIPENKVEQYLLSPGDIVVARTGATTGYAKRLNKRHPRSIFASYLVRIRINRSCSNRYVGQIIEGQKYKSFIARNVGGAAQPNANAQVLTSMPIVVPSKRLLDKFDRMVEKLIDLREVLENASANLCAQRDLLLPKLISGEIDVSAAPALLREAAE